MADAKMTWNNQLQCYEVVTTLSTNTYHIYVNNLYKDPTIENSGPKAFLGNTRFKLTFPEYTLKNNSDCSHTKNYSFTETIQHGKHIFSFDGNTFNDTINSSNSGILLNNNHTYTSTFNFSIPNIKGFVIDNFSKITSTNFYLNSANGNDYSYLYYYINMGYGNYTLRYGPNWDDSMSVPRGRIIGKEWYSDAWYWFYKDFDNNKVYFDMSMEVPYISSIGSNAIVMEMRVHYTHV